MLKTRLTVLEVALCAGCTVTMPCVSDGSLGGLATLSNARTRCVSPENPTGEPGKAAMATPTDPVVRNVNNASHAAGELGRGWKVNPYVHIGPGETFTLMDAEGPGVIRHIWMTLTGRWRTSIIRMYWDGETTPSVEVPAADFFCQGWNEYAPVVSEPVCVNPGSAFNCYWTMPFRRRCRITMENVDAKQMTLYYFIDYEETEVGADQAYFHAQFRRTIDDPTSDFTLLDDVRGRGQYVGTYLAWGVHNAGWWGEGEVKFFVDDDRDFPTVCSTGLEDYFCGSYNFDRGGRYAVFNTPYAGLCQVLPPDVCYKSGQKFGLYRWHVKDPIRFTKSLRVTAQDLGWKEGGRYLDQHSEIAATTFWYQTEPHAPFPKMGEVGFLRPKDWELFADFEGKDYGAWKAEGEAFGPGPAQGTLPKLADELPQNPVSGYQGHGLVNTYYKGDDTTGTLTSPTFTVRKSCLEFLVGGGNYAGETCVNLLVDGKVVLSVTGKNNEKLEPVQWNLAPYKGKSAQIQIVDRRKGHFGHINADAFYFSGPAL